MFSELRALVSTAAAAASSIHVCFAVTFPKPFFLPSRKTVDMFRTYVLNFVAAAVTKMRREFRLAENPKLSRVAFAPLIRCYSRRFFVFFFFLSFGGVFSQVTAARRRRRHTMEKLATETTTTLLRERETHNGLPRGLIPVHNPRSVRFNSFLCRRRRRRAKKKKTKPSPFRFGVGVTCRACACAVTTARKSCIGTLRFHRSSQSRAVSAHGVI